MLTGQYNRKAYWIFSDDAEIYAAGNSPHDSQAYLPADQGVGLRLMRLYCLSTLRELAEERGETAGGVERVDES